MPLVVLVQAILVRPSFLLVSDNDDITYRERVAPKVSGMVDVELNIDGIQVHRRRHLPMIDHVVSLGIGGMLGRLKLRTFKQQKAARKLCIKTYVQSWWSRGESNPCPKTRRPEHLRAQSVF